MYEILVIHGMNQQYQSELELARECEDALHSGLLAAWRAQNEGQRPDLSQYRVRLAFYGDLFRKEMTLGGEETDAATAKKVDSYLQHLDRENELTVTTQGRTHATKSDQTLGGNAATRSWGTAKVNGFLEFLSSRTDKAQFVGLAMARQWASHLHTYLSQESMRVKVQSRVKAQWDEVEPQLVLGHSMGTLVGYQYLVSLTHPVRFITMGSPLAIDTVRNTAWFGELRGKFEKTQHSWQDIAAQHDWVVAKPLKQDFPSLTTHTIHNGSGENAHDLKRYLNAATTGRVIMEMLKTPAASVADAR